MAQKPSNRCPPPERVETSRIYVEMASDRVKQAVADW
jgi:hypothetical protein